MCNAAALTVHPLLLPRRPIWDKVSLITWVSELYFLYEKVGHFDFSYISVPKSKRQTQYKNVKNQIECYVQTFFTGSLKIFVFAPKGTITTFLSPPPPWWSSKKRAGGSGWCPPLVSGLVGLLARRLFPITTTSFTITIFMSTMHYCNATDKAQNI